MSRSLKTLLIRSWFSLVTIAKWLLISNKKEKRVECTLHNELCCRFWMPSFTLEGGKVTSYSLLHYQPFSLSFMLHFPFLDKSQCCSSTTKLDLQIVPYYYYFLSTFIVVLKCIQFRFRHKQKEKNEFEIIIIILLIIIIIIRGRKIIGLSISVLSICTLVCPFVTHANALPKRVETNWLKVSNHRLRLQFIWSFLIRCC